jgi:hypothetical protein
MERVSQHLLRVRWSGSWPGGAAYCIVLGHVRELDARIMAHIKHFHLRCAVLLGVCHWAMQVKKFGIPVAR